MLCPGRFDDEVTLDCPDDYDNLPAKTRKILEWSVRHKYDFTYLLDTDTFIVPRLLAQCGFEKYDIAGRFGNMPKIGEKFNYKDDRGFYPNIYGWCSGGVGYFISKKAAEIIVATEPMIWAEDAYSANALGQFIESGEIKAADLQNFENTISWHFPRKRFQAVYSPHFGWQEEMQAQYGVKHD